MSNFQLFFCYLGFSFLSYCIGRLINNFAISFDGTLYEESIYSYFFSFLSLLFYLFGLPVLLSLRAVQSVPNRRMLDAAVQEEREKWKKRCESEVQIAVRLERDRVYDDLKERYTFVPKK
ncbi:MAG: hypothetical protein ACOX7M_06195 [Dysosmobacter sp.]|uniref:hypothetical protein n=1 Tax=Dysosmobacter sp. TaxID=2591382 RepID=UPI003D8FFA28